MPYECNINEDEFIDKLSLLESYIDNVGQSSFAIIGDFNSNIKPTDGRISSKFAKYVIEFCERNEIIFSSQKLLPPDSYTYISERWAGSTSWLDFLLASTDFHGSVRNLNIKYELTYNDHIPISFDICTTVLPPLVACETTNVTREKVSWKNMSKNQLELYATFTDLMCHQINFENILPICSDANCNIVEHRSMLGAAYDKFINCLNTSANKACTFTKTSTRPPGKPGWTAFVKEKHAAAIDSYKILEG